MIYSEFPILLVFLSAIPFYGTVCRKRRPERLFAAGLMLNWLLFYAACAVGLCRAGFYAIFAANLSLCIPALAKLRKDPGALRRFLTPGVLTVYLALTCCFILAAGEWLLTWDEFSHWGSSAKLLFEYGKLNCGLPRLLGHASYPPGLPVLDTLVHRCFFGVPFSESLPRFAVRAAKICFFAVALEGRIERRTFRECAAGMLLFWLVSCWIFPVDSFSCESDCLLGVLFATAVYTVLRHDRSRRDDLFLALLLGWLFLIKKAGLGFAVMVQALYAARLIADRFSGERKKLPTWSALAVLVAPFAAQFLWSLLLRYCRTPIVFPVGSISAERICRLVRCGEPRLWREIAGPFFHRFARVALPPLAVAFAGLIHYRATAEKRRPRATTLFFWFLPIALAVYTTSMFLTYLFIFTPRQAHDLVSFPRYIGAFTIMPVLVMLMLEVSGGAGGKARQFFTSYTFLALAAAFLAYMYRNENYRDAPRITLKFPAERAELDGRYGKILRDPETRFAVVSGAGKGLYLHIFRYLYEDRIVGEALIPNPAGGRDHSAAELREKLFGRARYVLVVHPHQSLKTQYAELWEEPPVFEGSFTLFEVAPDQRLRPVR